MAHGWDSYFHRPEPLSSDPRALRVSSESEGNLSQPIENVIGHHDFSNMVASQEAPTTNSDFYSNPSISNSDCIYQAPTTNSDFYSNPSVSSSDCVYQRYYGDVPWQADGQQAVKDGLSRCGNGDISNFTTDELPTSGHFPSSFAADLQEIKQDCGALTSSFLENYSDVSSCSEADINEARPSCKFMKSNSEPKDATHEIDGTKKHSRSEWPFTPTGNMSIPVESSCPHISETPLVLPSQALSENHATEKVVASDAQSTTERVENIVKTCKQTNDQMSATSKNNTTIGSESVDENDKRDDFEERQQRKVDVGEERALIHESKLDTPIAGPENLADDTMEEERDGNEEEQTCHKQVTTVVATNSLTAFCSVGKDNLDDTVQEKETKELTKRKNHKNEEACDRQENLDPSLTSMAGQDENIRKDYKDKEKQSSTSDSSDLPGRKVSDSPDATHKLREYTCNLDVTSDIHNLESSSQDVDSCLQVPEHQPFKRSSRDICSDPVENSACDSIHTHENDKQGSDHLESRLQPNNSSIDLKPCLEKDRTSPAEKTSMSSFVDQQQSLQHSEMPIEPPCPVGVVPENTRESFQEMQTPFEQEQPVLAMLYGEPLSREDSPREADETSESESNEFEDGSVTRYENESMHHLEVQAAQMKCSVQTRKRLQPIVVLKTLEPGNDTKAYHCAGCQHSAENVDNLIEHHHSSHSLQKFQFCPTCNVYLLNNEGPETHLCTDEALRPSFDSDLQKKSQRRYKCNSCRHTFPKLYHYIKHMRIHTGKTPYKCSGCSWYFSQSSSLYRHKRIPGRCPGKKQSASPANTEAVISKTQKTQKDTDVHKSPSASLPECYVKLVDVRETNICHICSKGFTTTENLKKHSHSVHKCSKNVSEDNTVNRDAKGNGKHKCPLCPRVFKYSYNRARHLRDCIKELTYGGKGKIGNKYQCPLCHATFTFVSNRHRHIQNTCLKEYHRRRMKTQNKERDEKKKQTPPTSTAPQNVQRYKCGLCPATFCYASGKYKHMKKHELFKITGKTVGYRNSVFFPISKQKFSSKKPAEGKDTLTSSETSSSLVFTCCFCGKCFNTSFSLKKHEHNHKGERPYRCLECGKGFKRHAHLITHKMVHQRRIQCTVCRKILPTIWDLIQHRKSHLKKGMLQCPDCPMQFQYPVYLLRHLPSHKRVEKKALEIEEKPPLQPQVSFQSLKEHKEQKQFQCSLCKEILHDSQELRRHCLNHISGSSSRQCPFCKRHFTCRRNLLRHMYNHTGVKPFPCTICGKRFYRKEYLRLHQEKCSSTKPRHVDTGKAVERGPKQFPCSYCPRVFTRRNRLKKHHTGHVSKSLLTCSKCGQFFGFTKLTQHERGCNGPLNSTALSTVSGHCDKSFAKDDKKVHEMALKSNGTGTKGLPHNCPNCPQRFKYRSLLLRHIVSHADRQSYECMHCGHKYGSKSMCLKHEAFCDGVDREGQSVNKSDVPTKLLVASSFRDAKEKRQVDGDNEYKCKFCTKSFMKSRNLRRHILTHNEVKPYRCKACDSCFSRYDYLKLHQTRCNGKRRRLEVCIPKISLDAVGKGWQNNLDSLAIKKQQTLGCNLCSKSFSTKSNLNRHFSMHHATKSFTCNRCGASFSHETSLKRHRILRCRSMSIKTNGSLQELCNPQTENMEKLFHGETIQIKQVNFNKRQKHVCMFCPRSFRTNSQLIVHTRLHTGEKPYGCDSCGERFIRKDYLHRHFLKCNGKGEPIDLMLCDRCGGFFSNDKLEIHKKSCTVMPSSPDHSKPSSPPTPAKGFSCAYCSSRFLLFSQLQQHFLNAHKQDNPLKSPVSTSPLQQHLSNIVSIKEEPLDEGEGDGQLSGDGNLLFDDNIGLDSEKNKPFQCSDCNMRFVNKAGLCGHVRIHSRHHPFTCKRCKKGFWNKNLQRNHFRKCKGLGNVAKMNTNLESVAVITSEIDLALNDSVLLFNQGSKTTGTGVLQTNFSCKDDPKDVPPQDSERNREQTSSSTEKKPVQYQCSECDQSFTDGLLLISHLEDHGRMEQEKKCNKCSKCGKIYSSRGNLEKHMKVHEVNKTYSCPDCSETFLSSKDLAAHKTCHDPNRPFACKVCRQRFWTSHALCNHCNATHPQDVYTCNFCSKSYSIRKSLLRHYRARHQNERSDEHIDAAVEEESKTEQFSTQVNAIGESDQDSESRNDNTEDSDSDAAPYFPCHVCGKTFLTSESLEDHQRCHLGEKPHECAECGKCFFQASQLQQHQRMHKSEFQCQTCGRGFVSLFALRKHKHTHGKSRPYRCSKCHLSFTGPSQLAEHMATHREDNFPCDICNRTFSCKSSRAEHRKSHSESSIRLPPLTSKAKRKFPLPSTMMKHLKYRCGVCHERFKDPEELSEHGCMAAKERPYSCPDCDKHFLHGSHLKKHTATHRQAEPYVYQCYQCNIIFPSRKHFLIHLKRHRDNDPAAEKKGSALKYGGPPPIFKCPICHQHFSSAVDLLGHFSVHSDDTHECKICKLTFPTNGKLKEHESCHLTAATQFECTECGQDFLGSDAFRQHHCSRQQHAATEGESSAASTEKPPVTVDQTVGEKEKEEEEEEEEEEVDVTGEDIYNCGVCSKRFSSKSCLLEHQNKQHQTERPFKCEFCGKAFILRKRLKEHERRHRLKLGTQNKTQPVKRYRCFYCPVVLDTVQDMALHMKTHNEQVVGEHRCDMCYKSFTLLSLLRQHQESHVGQVVYECTECDKAFAFPHLLEKHQQTHAGPSR